MSPLVIALFLFVAALALLVIDVFLPTGGALIFLAVLSAVGAVVFGFQDSSSTGTWFVIATLAAVPAGFVFFLKVWPHTAIGKRMITAAPSNKNWQWTGNPPGVSLNELVGETGIVRNALMPIGMIEINGVKYEASGDGTLIDEDVTVVVTKVDMGVLVVNKRVESQPTEPTTATGPDNAEENHLAVLGDKSEDRRSPPDRIEGSALESLGIDSLEDE